MVMNLAGLGVIYNNSSTLNQQYFQLLAIPGSLSLVAVDGVIQAPSTYTIDRSVLIFNNPLPAGKWVYVISGQGGTFIPQSYVDESLEQKADREQVAEQLNTKANKSGANFTGSITVQEPTEPMNPVTLQMFETLPDIASSDYVDDAVANMVTNEVFETAVESLIDEDQKGVADGVGELDSQGKLKTPQVPLYLLYNKTDLKIDGNLSVGNTSEGWREKYDGVIDTLLIELGTAPTGSALRLNITKNGTGIYSEPNYIDVPAGSTSFTHTFVSKPSFVANDILGVEVEAVGSTVAGSNLSARLEVTHLPS